MKIRTIAIGIGGLPATDAIRAAGGMLFRAQEEFTRSGYEVQSRRILLDRWDLGLGTLTGPERDELLESLDGACADAKVDFCSIGMAGSADEIEQSAQVISRTRHLNVTAEIGSRERGVDKDAVRAAAQAIRYLASSTPGGLGNFRFGAGSCLGPGTPFFPGSFHDGGRSSFSIGLENSDLLVRAFRGSNTLDEAEQSLKETLTECYQRIVTVAEGIALAIGLPLRGLDTSIAPSLHPAESITLAFEAIGTKFGDPGTLAICGAITRVLKAIPVRQVGYCGLMLPVLEDVGLAGASGENRFDITDLLAYSSVCAVGVDMVPIPGDCPSAVIERILLDVGTLSVRLAKPLVARLLPVPGKLAGERTQFDFMFMCNGSVLKI